MKTLIQKQNENKKPVTNPTPNLPQAMSMQPRPYQSSIVCFQCGKRGHIARDCFTRSQSTNYNNNGSRQNRVNNGQDRNNRFTRPTNNTHSLNDQNRVINNRPNNYNNNNNRSMANENNQSQTYFTLSADELMGAIGTAIREHLN
ncbi:hypothetical protein F8M41_020192 [Gigaspora margarita]|uniref:CCHC-type domain-containing protein n=1 Tax=Gigaspora margarita TaxID=4874 RepID=A0A8H4EK12_GIGMA|nr:hypothetical protein F8M41_020192 [Gigaspora margarita]